MFCETCGFEVEEGDTYCGKCGRAVGGSHAATVTRRCKRAREGRVLAGVCAGCAEHFSKDVRVFRVMWMVAALIPPFFPGVAAYLVCWLLMPAPADTAPSNAALSD